RVWAHTRRRSAGDTMSRGVTASRACASTDSCSVGSPNATSTLPLELACTGLRLPTQLAITTVCAGVTWSTYTTWNPSRIARFAVSDVTAERCSSCGRAWLTTGSRATAAGARATHRAPARE